MKKQNQDIFIREVAEQLLPYIITEVEYVNEDGFTKPDLKHIFESNGAEVIDLDMLMEEEGEMWW